MTFDQIIAIIVAAAPSITAIAGIVLAVIKIIKSTSSTNDKVIEKFEEVRGEIFNTKEYSELKAKLGEVYQENIELKKTIRQLVDKVDHIYRGEE